MDLPFGNRFNSFAFPSFPLHANLTRRFTVPPLLPLDHGVELRLRRVQAPRHPYQYNLPASATGAASARLPDLRLQRRRQHAEADSASSLPPSESLRGPSRPRGLGPRAIRSEPVRFGAPGFRSVRECEDDR